MSIYFNERTSMLLFRKSLLKFYCVVRHISMEIQGGVWMLCSLIASINPHPTALSIASFHQWLGQCK